jgi:hypothetical protein
MAKVEEAFTNVAAYTKGRNKKNLKRTEETIKHDLEKV